MFEDIHCPECGSKNKDETGKDDENWNVTHYFICNDCETQYYAKYELSFCGTGLI